MYYEHFNFLFFFYFDNLLVYNCVLGINFHHLSNLFVKIAMNPI